MGITESLFDYLDGRAYTLNGIHGQLVVKRTDRLRLFHQASTAGRRHPDYVYFKRLLGDDWDSDLTYSESLVDIALELGFEDAN